MIKSWKEQNTGDLWQLFIQSAAGKPTTFKIVIVTKLFQLQWWVNFNSANNGTPLYFLTRLVKVTCGQCMF